MFISENIHFVIILLAVRTVFSKKRYVATGLTCRREVYSSDLAWCFQKGPYLVCACVSARAPWIKSQRYPMYYTSLRRNIC